MTRRKKSTPPTPAQHAYAEGAKYGRTRLHDSDMLDDEFECDLKRWQDVCGEQQRDSFIAGAREAFYGLAS